jgi:hypothetical protein
LARASEGDRYLYFRQAKYLFLCLRRGTTATSPSFEFSALPRPHTHSHTRRILGTGLDATALTGSPGTESQCSGQRWRTNQLQPPAAQITCGPRECFLRRPDPPPPPPPLLPTLAAAMSSDGQRCEHSKCRSRKMPRASARKRLLACLNHRDQIDRNAGLI